MHQCVHCGKFIESGSKEILEGCGDCGKKFFYYIREEQLQKIKERQDKPAQVIPEEDKKRIENKLSSIGLTPLTRAQELSVEDWKKLAKSLAA